MLATATVLAVVTLATVDQAVAQTALYERPRQNGISDFSHDATLRAQGWLRVVFPAREERAYARPPRAAPARGREAFARFFEEAARLFVLPLAYLTAVASVESGFDPQVISVDGAMGVMQLMPFTARRMGVTDPFDARQNILGGARFLRILANQWNGDLRLTTAAYNAGSGAVAKYRDIPPFRETQRYVAKVLNAYRRQRDRRRQSSFRSCWSPSTTRRALMSKDTSFTHYFSTAPNQLDLFGERGACDLPARRGAQHARVNNGPDGAADCPRTADQVRAAIDARSDEDWAEVLIAALLDGGPQTFETLTTSLAGATAEQACGTTAEAGLWLAVGQGRVLHTKSTPVLFRCAEKRGSEP